MREIWAVIALAIIVSMAMGELTRPIIYCIIAWICWEAAKEIAPRIAGRLMSFKLVMNLYVTRSTGRVREIFHSLLRGTIKILMQFIALIIFIGLTVCIGLTLAALER